MVENRDNLEIKKLKRKVRALSIIVPVLFSVAIIVASFNIYKVFSAVPPGSYKTFGEQLEAGDWNAMLDEIYSHVPSVDVYQCPEQITCDDGTVISGSWITHGCVGQISSQPTCRLTWFNGAIVTCDNLCGSSLGKMLVQ